MNILFASIILGIAVFIRIKFKPKGNISGYMFCLLMAVGLATLCSSMSFSNAAMSLMTALSLLCDAAILLIYAADSKRQAASADKAVGRQGEKSTPAAAVMSIADVAKARQCPYFDRFIRDSDTNVA